MSAVTSTRELTAAEHINRGLQMISRDITRAMRKIPHAYADAVRKATETANSPVRIAGIEARYYVRGALDPSWATPRQRDTNLAHIHAGAGQQLAFVNRTNRDAIATAALAGWTAHRPTTREIQ